MPSFIVGHPAAGLVSPLSAGSERVHHVLLLHLSRLARMGKTITLRRVFHFYLSHDILCSPIPRFDNLIPPFQNLESKVQATKRLAKRKEAFTEMMHQIKVSDIYTCMHSQFPWYHSNVQVSNSHVFIPSFPFPCLHCLFCSRCFHWRGSFDVCSSL